jgi:hypothetical protein
MRQDFFFRAASADFGLSFVIQNSPIAAGI